MARSKEELLAKLSECVVEMEEEEVVDVAKNTSKQAIRHLTVLWTVL